jgi:hypothetical protein
VNDGLSEILGRGLTSLVTLGDCPRGTKLLDDDRMIDGNICNPLIEIGNRISASVHDVIDETVRLANGASRIVHKQCLDVMPHLQKVRGFVGGERPYS